MTAANQGFAEAVEVLIQAGADVTHQDIFGRTAADRSKSPQIAALLVPKSGVSMGGEGVELRAKEVASKALFQASELLNQVAKEAEIRFTGEVQDFARSKLKSVYQQLKSALFVTLDQTCRDLGLEVPPTRLGSSDFNVEFSAEETDQEMEDTSEFIEKLLSEHYQPYTGQYTGNTLEEAASFSAEQLKHASNTLTQLCEDGTAALTSGFILQLQDSLSAYSKRLLSGAAQQLERSLEALIQARIDEIVVGNDRQMSQTRSFQSVRESSDSDSAGQFRSPQSNSKEQSERLVKTAGKSVPPRASPAAVPRTAVSSTLKQFLSSEIKFDF